MKREKKLKLRPFNQEIEEKTMIVKLNSERKRCYDFSIALNKVKSEKADILKEKQSLENKLFDQNKKIKDLEKINLILKEKLKNEYPKWEIEADLAWRRNPTTSDIEDCLIPIDFNIKKVRNLKINKNNMTRDFDYIINSKPDNIKQTKSYKNVPDTLFNRLNNKKFKFKYSNSKNELKSNIKNIDDLKNLLMKKGTPLNGKYKENVNEFIVENIGKSFTTKEFIKNCQFNNRESARQYLQKLQEYEVIRKFGQGIYKVII